MKIHLVALSSDICEDDFTEGEGAETGCGYGNEKIGQTFTDMPEMLKYLAGHYGLSENLSDYEQLAGELQTSKPVANHADQQNGGWFDPTEEEFAKWRLGELKLYTEHYVIRYHHIA